MTLTKTIRHSRTFRLAAAGLLLTACASGGGAAWTYAPLGPTPNPSAGASVAPTPGGSPGTSPGTSPGQSPGQSPGTAFEVSTPAADPLAYVPPELSFPAGTAVTVNYLNDSVLEHNINFFDGADSTAPSLGATLRVTGPGALETVTFTTPAEPGDYYFWCDVHFAAMDGIWRVTQ